MKIGPEERETALCLITAAASQPGHVEDATALSEALQVHGLGVDTDPETLLRFLSAVCLEGAVYVRAIQAWKMAKGYLQQMADAGSRFTCHLELEEQTRRNGLYAKLLPKPPE